MVNLTEADITILDNVLNDHINRINQEIRLRECSTNQELMRKWQNEIDVVTELKNRIIGS